MKDILTVMEENGVEIVQKGGILRAYCPFHSDTTTPNFTVYEKTNSWFCFACNIGGGVVEFISKLKNISREEAKISLQENQVDIEELKEKINGIENETQPLTFNNELNITVSRLCRNYMYEHPEKSTEVLQVLKEFDQQLLQPITKEKMDTILNSVKQKLIDHE